MHNYITLFISVLVHTGVITKAEGDRLAKEFESATLPSDFESCFQLVKDIFEKANVESKVKAK